MAANKTLLDIVQDILRSVSGPEINSISDTTESLDIAHAVKESYEYLLVTSDSVEHNELFELVAAGPVKPVIMSTPNTINSIEWVRYDTKLLETDDSLFTKIIPLSLDEFLEKMYNSVSSSNTNQASFSHLINGSSVEVFCFTDRAPTYYTTLDDNTLLFDAFNSSLEANLQNQKSLAFGKISPVFLIEDDYVPRLAKEQLQLLIQEAKAQVSIEHRQVENGKAEKRARELKIRNINHKDRVNLGIGYHNDPRLPHFGRK